MNRIAPSIAILSLFVAALQSPAKAEITHHLNVQVIQVCNDAGSSCAALDPSGSGQAYLYESQINEIWAQAGIQISLSVTQWNNTEAQRLDSTELNQVFGNTFSSSTGDPLPGIATDAVQVFFVNDHIGTGFDGTAGSGWVGNPLPDPSMMARNAGIAEVSIAGTFVSNGRAVMANEGFAADQLSGTLAHELGHLLGLRHIDDVNSGAAGGTTQDPNFSLDTSTPNLMWEAGSGPSFNNSLSLVENFDLLPEQIDAAIFNGTRLDPDGNGIGVLIAVPEPSAMFGLMLIGITIATKRRRRLVC